MPELPEVETVRRGLAAELDGHRIVDAVTHRPDLRFPFPARLAEQVADRKIIAVRRRAKYLLIDLLGGGSILSHLGMTGNYRFLPEHGGEEGRHDHLSLLLAMPDGGKRRLVYSDPRRFGFVDLVEQEETNRFLRHLGPEPLSNDFNGAALAERLARRASPVKTALLDQKVVAGLGNIYVCEALFRVGISPMTPARDLSSRSDLLNRLAATIRDILLEAIESGGSTLKDYRKADGSTGLFQQRFRVYGREGKACVTPSCKGTISRFTQGGRSTFCCEECQT